MQTRRGFFGALSAILVTPPVAPVLTATRATPWTAQDAYRGLNMRSEHIFALPALFQGVYLQEIADTIDQRYGQDIVGWVMGPCTQFRYGRLVWPNPMWCSGETPFASADVHKRLFGKPIDTDKDLDVRDVLTGQFLGGFLLVRVDGSRR